MYCRLLFFAYEVVFSIGCWIFSQQNQFVEMKWVLPWPRPFVRNILLSDRIYSSQILSMSKSAFKTSTYFIFLPNDMINHIKINSLHWLNGHSKFTEKYIRVLVDLWVHELANLHANRVIASSNPNLQMFLLSVHVPSCVHTQLRVSFASKLNIRRENNKKKSIIYYSIIGFVYKNSWNRNCKYSPIKSAWMWILSLI